MQKTSVTAKWTFLLQNFRSADSAAQLFGTMSCRRRCSYFCPHSTSIFAVVVATSGVWLVLSVFMFLSLGSSQKRGRELENDVGKPNEVAVAEAEQRPRIEQDKEQVKLYCCNFLFLWSEIEWTKRLCQLCWCTNVPLDLLEVGGGCQHQAMQEELEVPDGWKEGELKWPLPHYDEYIWKLHIQRHFQVDGDISIYMEQNNAVLVCLWWTRLCWCFLSLQPIPCHGRIFHSWLRNNIGVTSRTQML